MRRTKRTKKHPPRTPVRSSCRTLVPADSTTIRRKLLNKLKSAERRFERAQEEWTRHQEHDLPAFERWQHIAVGALRQEWMGVTSKINLYEEFLRHLGHEEWIQEVPLRQLARSLNRFAESKDHGEPEHRLDGDWSPAYLIQCGFELWEEPRRRAKEERRKQHARNPNEDPGTFDEFLEGLFDILDDDDDDDPGEPLDRPDPSFDDGGPDDPWSDFIPHDIDGSPTGPERRASLRSLYRKLCRCLHPDLAETVTPYTQRLWHDVQDAHETGDLERMEAIHASWELKCDPSGKQSTCARILAAIAECTAGLRSLQKQLRSAKKHLSWNFADLKDPARARLERSMKAEFSRELTYHRRRLTLIVGAYRELFRPTAARPARARPRKRKINSMDGIQTDFF